MYVPSQCFLLLVYSKLKSLNFFYFEHLHVFYCRQPLDFRFYPVKVFEIGPFSEKYNSKFIMIYIFSAFYFYMGMIICMSCRCII